MSFTCPICRTVNVDPTFSVPEFLAARTTPDPGGVISVQAFYDAYQAWCLQGQLTPATKKKFGHILNTLGVANTRTMHCRGRAGIRLA